MYSVLQVADDLNPLRCLALLRAIPRRDCELLDIAGRPEDLLMLAVPVGPEPYISAALSLCPEVLTQASCTSLV